MNIFELLIYLATTAFLVPAMYLSMMDFAVHERSLDRQIDISYEALIQAI